MPYIITTRRPYPYKAANAVPSDATIDTRTAVATLKEMRQHARNAVEDCAQAPGWTPKYVAARNIARDLPAEGGSIGPLPDGTVIEVQAVCWNWIIGIADDRGVDTDAVHGDGGDLAIIAAFNGAA